MAAGKKSRKREKNSESASKKGKKFTLDLGRHPYGVEPLGNLFGSEDSVDCRKTSLGTFSVLNDATLLELLSYLDGQSLCALSVSSKFMYAFSHQDDLWKNVVLHEYGGNFEFQSSWRCTYQKHKTGTIHKPLKVKSVYSDILFQSWLCASLKMKPEWLSRNNIPRRSNLSVEEFVKEFEEPNKPVIITDALKDWHAVDSWTRGHLLELSGKAEFAAGPVNLTLERYFKYADNVVEERPLYIFDPQFGEKAADLKEDYSVPKYFQEDLFSVLGAERPDFRWLIIGPTRSGSSWHIDPNSTSAWNAVISGAKKWILYPPDEVPPGVIPSPDGADVATSVSLMEWFMNFYEEAVDGTRPRPMEAICGAGELMFVPRGWWHMVVNIEESIAITQNFVSRRNILEVLEFLQRPNARVLVSGTKERESLYGKFKRAFESSFPGELDILQRKKAEMLEKSKSQFWESVKDTSGSTFKFGF